MLLPAMLAASFALQPAAWAGKVPTDIQEQLAEVHKTHSAPLLIVTLDSDVLDDLGKWLTRDGAPHVVRKLPAMGTLSYEVQIALDRVELRCGVMIDALWHVEELGDCTLWSDGPSSLHASVPAAQPTTARSYALDRGASLAISPAMGLGTVVDFSGELRASRRGSVAATVTAVQVRELGSPALMGVQGRHYFWGDFDRGMYGLVQVGILSMESGTVRSPGAAVGLGLKYTTKPGLMADVYAGAGPGWPVRIHPALGTRVGWSF